MQLWFDYADRSQTAPFKNEMAHGIENDIVKSTVKNRKSCRRVARNCKPVIINGKAAEDDFHELIDNESNSAISVRNNTVVKFFNISRKQTLKCLQMQILILLFSLQILQQSYPDIQSLKSRLNALHAYSQIPILS